MSWTPELVRSTPGPGPESLELGHPLVDGYLAFIGARARPNTHLATAYDLKVFFTVIAKEPLEITTTDVLAFIEQQRRPRRGSNVVRLEDGEAGLSARTIKRRISTVSGLFSYLMVRGDIASDPVPRGLVTRRVRGGKRETVPLLRVPRALPRVMSSDDASALLVALRTRRDQAMVQAMLLGGLRRCEVLGLRLEDLKPGQNRVFVAEGKGGHQRVVPLSPRCFQTVGDYLDHERPRTSQTDSVFVVLKGPHRGRPLTASGVDEIVRGACRRAGIEKVTCHQLRHTCLTRLREAGMALEAVQAQAGHASIESTRIYLHLTNDWLAGEYMRAAEAIAVQAIEAGS